MIHFIFSASKNLIMQLCLVQAVAKLDGSFFLLAEKIYFSNIFFSLLVNKNKK